MAKKIFDMFYFELFESRSICMELRKTLLKFFTCKTNAKSLLVPKFEKSNIKALIFKNILNQDTVQIKHRSLTSFLKKDLKSPKQVEQVLKQCPETSRYIGALPNSWLSHIPKVERAAYTKKINDLFSDFARQTSLPKNVDDDVFVNIINRFAKKIRSCINQNIEVSFLGKGTIGRTFKIKSDDEAFVIKTFFPDVKQHLYYSTHGKGAEICSAVYASKHAIKGQFADFYFGKFARHNDNDGFLVTKFIDLKNARMSNIKNKTLDMLLDNKVVCADFEQKGNYVLDTILDYGAVSKNPIYTDKQIKIVRLLKEAINTSDKDKYNNILEKYKGSDLDCVLKREKEAFLDFFEGFKMLCKFLYYPKPTGAAVKITTSNLHNKVYKSLKHAIHTENKAEYETVINQYKETKALDEILKHYNYDLDKRTLNGFDMQISCAEAEKLVSTLKDFGILLGDKI